MNLLKRSTLVLAILASPFAICRHTYAQLSVYGAATLTGYGFNSGDSSSYSFKRDSGGVTGGVFYNFPIQSRVTVGLDGRVEETPGGNGGAYATAALRVGFVPHKVRLRPYFQLGGGVVHSGYTSTVAVVNGFTFSYVTSQQNYTSGAAQLLFGLDVRITHSFDWRAIEYGANASGGNGVTANVAYLDTGIVYHLHPKT